MKKNVPKIYQSNSPTLPGSSHAELLKNAWKVYNDIAATTRRRPYIRTGKKSYFRGQKVFLNLYLPHINQKNRADADRRLKLVLAALDLVKNNTYPPILERSNPKTGEILQRFLGQDKTGTIFCAQIRISKEGDRCLMSAFPVQ